MVTLINPHDYTVFHSHVVRGIEKAKKLCLSHEDRPTLKSDKQGEQKMVEINLRDHYPELHSIDFIVNVSDDLAAQFFQWCRDEKAYRRQLYRYKAHYSLDRNTGIQHDILFISLAPGEIYERKVTYEQLYTAILNLPEKQRKRLYAHYFLGMSKAAISRAEDASRSAVTDSINRALRSLEVFLRRLC